MKRLFLVLAFVFTVQAQAQDEIPTPEAFANDCRAELVLYMQQYTKTVETLLKAIENPEIVNTEKWLRIPADLDTAIARGTIKFDTCLDLAKILGEDYLIQLDKLKEDPEVKLAIYKWVKATEKMELLATSNRREENQLSQNTLTEEELRLSHFPEEEMTLIADDYIHAIRQKVERNWIKPLGSREMPLCKVHVEQGPGGIILDVGFSDCDGSTATYRASIQNAIYKSEPLPAPEDPELFERDLNFYFEPGESSATAIQRSSTRERSTDEIEHVFQKNKDGLFNLYNRELRRHPSLAGQVVVELTISSGGQVTAAKVLSSELGDEALEQKLIAKIKKFKFTKKDVQEITLTYPIDFLPS